MTNNQVKLDYFHADWLGQGEKWERKKDRWFNALLAIAEVLLFVICRDRKQLGNFELRSVGQCILLVQLKCCIENNMKEVKGTELTVAQIMNSLLTNSDLTWRKYNYTVKVTNIFKGLDLIESAWRTMDGDSWHCTEGRDRHHPQEKEMQKGKMIVWGGLTNSCEKKKSERQRRKGKIHPFERRVPKNSKER